MGEGTDKPPKANSPRRLSGPRLLARAFLVLWWTFIVALAGSIAQYAGNHSGSLLSALTPQLIETFEGEPLNVQVAIGLVFFALLVVVGELTWRAWLERQVRADEEAKELLDTETQAFKEAMEEPTTELSEQIAKTGAENLAVTEKVLEIVSRPVPLAAGLSIDPVRDIRSKSFKSFKLGDDFAAEFPYIKKPIEEAFRTATHALHVARVRSPENPGKSGIIVLGETNAGKTRLALEALIDVLPDWELLRWSEARQTLDIPPAGTFTERNIVLFVDDVQNYAISALSSSESQRQAAVGASAVLRTLWEMLQSSAHRAILIATCRSSEEQRIHGGLSWLFTELAIIHVPSFPSSASDPAAAQIIEMFREHGASRDGKWDGTLGSLTLGLERKREEYENLGSLAATVLHAMKLLAISAVPEHTELRLRHICAGIFTAQQLMSDDARWEEAVSELIAKQFVTEELTAKSQLELAIRKDTYFEDVIIDYPGHQRPLVFEQHRMKLQVLFTQMRDLEALFYLGNGWYRAQRYEEALNCYDYALTPDLSNGVEREKLGIALE